MNKLEKVAFSQLRSMFCLNEAEEKKLIPLICEAEEKTGVCMMKTGNIYFNGEINPYNSVMYCVFLYWLSREAFCEYGRSEIADKVYYLNKSLNAVDLYYEIELPKIWTCEHPVGTIMGRASYSDGFFFSQGCTVGGNYNDGILCYPTIGKNVSMLSNSKIVGDSHIGNDVVMSANSYVINMTVPDNSIVFGQGRDVKIVERKDNQRYI